MKHVIYQLNITVFSSAVDCIGFKASALCLKFPEFMRMDRLMIAVVYFDSFFCINLDKLILHVAMFYYNA